MVTNKPLVFKKVNFAELEFEGLKLNLGNKPKNEPGKLALALLKLNSTLTTKKQLSPIGQNKQQDNEPVERA